MFHGERLREANYRTVQRTIFKSQWPDFAGSPCLHCAISFCDISTYISRESRDLGALLNGNSRKYYQSDKDRYIY